MSIFWAKCASGDFAQNFLVKLKFNLNFFKANYLKNSNIIHSNPKFWWNLNQSGFFLLPSPQLFKISHFLVLLRVIMAKREMLQGEERKINLFAIVSLSTILMFAIPF